MLKKIFFIIGLLGTLSFLQGSAHALSGTDWRAGRIIDDPIFTNQSSMSVQEIQLFLNTKLGTCDTYGQQNVTYQYPAGSGQYVTTTRALYADRQSNPKPTGQQIFTCLKDYYEVPKTAPSSDPVQNNYGYADPLSHVPAGAISAAQIILQAAQVNKISPKVLLVTLQKEQGLLSDDWPLNREYLYAMGAHCPDSGAGGSANCDANYASFSLQMNEGASLFRYYLDNMNQPWWPYKKPSQNNTIQWAVNTACGATSVYIDSMATAALYTYTPYQPNQAALNNLYGSGDGCSSYGNRNFWRTFNDWFGMSILDCNPNEQPYAEVMRLYNPSNYKHFYTVYPCEVTVMQNRFGYQLEGTSFYQTAGSSPYAVVVHRLYNPQTYQHLWVTTQDEIDMATQKAGYRYEGIAFFAVKSEVPGLVPVHRLYNPQTYEHLWVTTQDEINIATQKAGFRYEGVAFYAAPPPRTTP